jgi:alpha-L-rhamnosidase
MEMMMNLARSLPITLAVATALAALPAFADEPVKSATAPTLEAQFQDPPNSARPRVWWHWMNGNITKDGIAKDFAWMKRIGIGGMQNFDANLMTPQIVDKRLVYMTPEWKDAFRFATTEADRLGLELAIAASPGWSETGGPWVKPEDGLKKLVWSETTVTGGKPFMGKLTAPPQTTGPFGNLTPSGGIEEMLTGEKSKAPPVHYGEVKVLAFPVSAASELVPVAVRDGLGKALIASGLSDADLKTGVDIARSGQEPNPIVVLDYGKPVTARTLSMFAPGAAMMFAGALYSPRLEASDDGKAWRKIVDFETSQVTATYAFAPATARYFRVEFAPKKGLGLQMGEAAPGIAMGGDMFTEMGKAIMSKPLTVGDLRLFGDPRIDRFETKAGFAIAQDYFALTGPADGANGIAPGSVIDLTSKMSADGTLSWTPPNGQWRVLRFGYSLLGTTNHPAPPEATGLEVDKFDGAAVRRYIEHYIGMYKDASGGMIGKRGVQAILTDSIEVGAANWTPKMVEQFKRLRGYDPTPWMPALAGVLVGSRADSDKFLFDYRRTLADLMASEHYATVAAVAHENGLKVYGEALEDHRPSLGDDMSMRSHADIPMAAMWTHSRKDGPKLSYIADIKGAASVAHIYGQNLVAAESMTASMNPWAYSPKDLKRIIDLEFVTGVNRPVIHTSVHQPLDNKIPGLSLFIFGQYFNRHESWAEMAKPWVDYMSRNSYMLQQGRNVADIGYFYGEEAPLTGLYGDKIVEDAPVTSAYDFVSADALVNVLQNDGSDVVAPGGARYKALYLGGSSSKMSLAVLKKLAMLVYDGATIIGKAPDDNPGLAGDKSEYAAIVKGMWPGSASAQVGKGRVIVADSAQAGLKAMGVVPDLVIEADHKDADIPFVHRTLPDGSDIYFLVNRKDRAEIIAATFRVQGKKPELWDPTTGESSPLAYSPGGKGTIVTLPLAAEDAKFIVFRKSFASTKDAMQDAINAIASQAASLAQQASRQVTSPKTTLAGPWTVSFQPDRGAPATVTLPALAPLNENAEPGIKYFSGIATYSKDFTTPKGWKAGQSLWLDLGQVAELAEVLVNGKAAGGAWHAPFRINIGSAAKKGKNKLEVRVANLWVNRLIGDAQSGATKITYTTMPTYRADAPLRVSGLMGPVTLEAGGR